MNNQPIPDTFEFDEHRISELADSLSAQGVTQIMAVFVDVHGVPKAKATPITAFEKLCRGAELYTVGACEGLGLAGPHEDE
ncbi:MAG: glutamine synthetase, partial [Pseudomonadota bacterium]